MRIETRIADDLGDYFRHIDAIAKQSETERKEPAVLWFRGLDDMDHSLVPSLFRTETRVKRGDGSRNDYSQLHYAEDIRTQHYIAKNSHFFFWQNEPSSRVEWLEVMQHHSIKTRVLDWSESSVHALIFAIESFLKDSKWDTVTGNLSLPCVWVLKPASLNKSIFDYIKTKINSDEKKDQDEIKGLFKEMNYNASEQYTVLRNMKDFSDFETYAQTAETQHIDYIFNLSVINDELFRDRERIKKLLLEGDIINPYYYILSRIYSDGHILKNRILPPLAVVHPYHSERIKAQHGVFTVFPFYLENESDELCRAVGINPDAMQNNLDAANVLHQIIIANPQKIAYELLQNGMNDSWLYPEMPVVANEIENHKIYV